MKIAIDTREASGPKVGKGWYTFVMVKELLKMDPENQYILYTNEYNPAYEKYDNAFQKVITKKGMAWHFAVRRDLYKTRPDIFWAPTSYIIPAFAPRWLTTFITVHDIIAFLFPESHNKKAVWLERLTLRRALKKAKKVFTVSRNTKNDLLKMFNVPEDKVVIAPCASSKIFTRVVDKVRHREVQEKYGLPQKFILGLGTLSPRKNFTRLIQAYALTEPKHRDTHLVIVGPKGWSADEILESAQREKVHLVGYAEGEDIAVMYSLAEVFVFPSLYEGFGMPPLEAMACGCPVITSDVSSLPEVVGNGAMLIDPYSVQEIAHAMDVILTNRYVAHDLREKGFERVKKFSWKHSAQKVLDAFYSLSSEELYIQPKADSAARLED